MKMAMSIFLLGIIFGCGEPVPSPQEIQLEQEKQKLEDLRQNMNALERRQQQEEQQATYSFPTQISLSFNEIENLTALLEEHRLAENDINQAASAYLREQSSIAGAQRDQIDSEIENLEREIQRTQEGINYWRFPPELPEQKTELENLRSQLVTQRQQLEELRARKVNISSDVVLQSRMIASQAQQYSEDLKTNEAAIQDQITSLRDEVIRLQNERTRLRTSSVSLAEQLRQQRQNIIEQKSKVNALENSLNLIPTN